MGCLSNGRNSLSNSPRKLATVVAATDQGRRYTSSHVLLIVFTCFYAKFLHSPAMKDLAKTWQALRHFLPRSSPRLPQALAGWFWVFSHGNAACSHHVAVFLFKHLNMKWLKWDREMLQHLQLQYVHIGPCGMERCLPFAGDLCGSCELVSVACPVFVSAFWRLALAEQFSIRISTSQHIPCYSYTLLRL